MVTNVITSVLQKRTSKLPFGALRHSGLGQWTSRNAVLAAQAVISKMEISELSSSFWSDDTTAGTSISWQPDQSRKATTAVICTHRIIQYSSNLVDKPHTAVFTLARICVISLTRARVHRHRCITNKASRRQCDCSWMEIISWRTAPRRHASLATKPPTTHLPRPQTIAAVQVGALWCVCDSTRFHFLTTAIWRHSTAVRPRYDHSTTCSNKSTCSPFQQS